MLPVAACYVILITLAKLMEKEISAANSGDLALSALLESAWSGSALFTSQVTDSPNRAMD